MKLVKFWFFCIPLCFYGGNIFADIYKCTDENGQSTYTQTPCGANAQKIESAVSSHKETDKADHISPASQDKQSSNVPAATRTLIGEWKSRGTVYKFGYGGDLRSDEYYGGKLIVWRTGTWSLEENKLTLKYTKFGGSMGSGKMSYTESGTINWKPDNMSFKVRLDGVNAHFSRQN